MTYVPSLNQIGIKLTKLAHFEIFPKNRDLVGRAGRSKNGRSYFRLILHHFSAIFSTKTKFHQNWTKNTKVENFSKMVGQKNGRSHLKWSFSIKSVINDLHTKFEPNSIKIDRVSPWAHHEIFTQKQRFGWSGRSAWVKLAQKFGSIQASHKKSPHKKSA